MKKKYSKSIFNMNDKSVQALVKNDLIRIKCVWHDDKRYVWVPQSVTLTVFQKTIEKKYDQNLNITSMKFPNPSAPEDLITITARKDIEMVFEYNLDVYIIGVAKKLRNAEELMPRSATNPEIVSNNMKSSSPVVPGLSRTTRLKRPSRFRSRLPIVVSSSVGSKLNLSRRSFSTGSQVLDQVVNIKITWDGDSRHIWVPRTMKIEDLLSIIQDKFQYKKYNPNLQLKLRDPLSPDTFFVISANQSSLFIDPMNGFAVE